MNRLSRDEASCAAMAAGDVDEHRAHLSRTALRLSGDSETARDLVQETLARAWASFVQFTPGSNARAWLVTILMRLFYDHLKHARVISKAEPEILSLIHISEPTRLLSNSYAVFC